MGSMVSLCTQELETKGWTVVEKALSPQLLVHLNNSYKTERVPDLRLTRQIFEGLSMRIINGLIGEAILSGVRTSLSGDWHRGRQDVVVSGAPPEFIPGFDLVVNIGSQPLIVEVISGSGRLPAGVAPPESISTNVELVSENVAIFESRLLRRSRGRDAGSFFWFSVIRPWLTPEDDVSGKLRPEWPERALRFYGVPWIPVSDIGEWLFKNHNKGV